MRSTIAVVWIVLASTALASTAFAQSKPSCDTPAHHAFDFWLGDWDVKDAKGNAAGSSHVERILDQCVIFENWTSPGYEGKSFNTLNPKTQKWTQYWVDTAGTTAEMTGAFEDKNLVYQRDMTRRDGTPAKSRMTFFNLADGRVRQLVEQSTDNGKTWTTQLDLHYTKKK